MIDRGKYTSTRGGAGGSRRAQDARGGWCARPGRIPARLTTGSGRMPAAGARVGWTPDNRRATQKKKQLVNETTLQEYPFYNNLYQRTLAAKTEFAVAKNATWGKRRIATHAPKAELPEKLPHPPHRLDGVIGAAERGEAGNPPPRRMGRTRRPGFQPPARSRADNRRTPNCPCRGALTSTRTARSRRRSTTRPPRRASP